MNSQLTAHNSLRFSLTSCATEDSADSASVATPLDVSPCPQRNTGFPIINPPEHESPYLTRYQIPDVAAVVGRHRHHQHGTLSPLPRSIRIIQTQDLSPPSLSQRLPTTNNTSLEQTTNRQQQEHENEQEQKQEQQGQSSSSQYPSEQQRSHYLIFTWPRVKRIFPRSSSSSASSSSSSISSTTQHHQHMRKKPSSSRGVMSHLSSLVCNSMRLANSMGTTTDQQLHQQQKLDHTTLSSSAPHVILSQKKKATQTSTHRWFGKNKSRVAPHSHPSE